MMGNGFARGAAAFGAGGNTDSDRPPPALEAVWEEGEGDESESSAEWIGADQSRHPGRKRRRDNVGGGDNNRDGVRAGRAPLGAAVGTPGRDAEESVFGRMDRIGVPEERSEWARAADGRGSNSHRVAAGGGGPLTEARTHAGAGRGGWSEPTLETRTDVTVSGQPWQQAAIPAVLDDGFMDLNRSRRGSAAATQVRTNLFSIGSTDPSDEVRRLHHGLPHGSRGESDWHGKSLREEVREG